MKIALVYDRVNKFGGAEQVLLKLHELFLQAPLYTAVYNGKKAAWAKVFPQIIPSFLQSWPWAKTHHELYPWLTPMAFESFDFRGFDLVISVTSAEAKAIITRPETIHICYCLTPTRYLWSHQQQYLSEPGLGRWLKPWQKYLRQQDLIFSRRPDQYIAISKVVQQRIKKYYDQDSQLIYPPVDVEKFFQPEVKPEKYFLIVSRLVAYKKIDLAIKVFNRLKLNLAVVGQGRDESRLRRLAGPTIKFYGWQSEADLISLYQGCRGLIMPQEEDFGISAVEAQAAGRPVIAFNRGGAAETVINGQSGILFDRQTVDSLTAAVEQSISLVWQPELICRQAKKFAAEIFINKWKKILLKPKL